MAHELVESLDGYHPHFTTPDQDPQGIPYEICRWPDILTLCNSLEQQIKNSGINFTLVIRCLRGGNLPGQDLARRLKLPHDSIWITRYTGIGKTGRLRLKQEPQTPLAEELILGVEDIVDKGDSARFLHHYLTKRGVKHFALATLHQKPYTTTPADFIAAPPTSRWVVYPWEYPEFFSEKITAWDQPPSDSIATLHSLGFTSSEITATLSNPNGLVQAMDHLQLPHSPQLFALWQQTAAHSLAVLE